MKISVVIIVFNGRNHLPEAIESILGQDAEEFECIVVDDGSTDGTSEFLANQDDPRLRVVSLPVNCGPGIARNIGVRSARGDYLAIMDADDVAFPERLSVQADFLDANPGVHILGSRIVRVAETISNVIDAPRHPLADADIKSRLLLQNGSAIIHPTTMLRADFINRNGLNYTAEDYNEDHIFWVRCVKAGATFQTLEQPLLYKRRHGSNLTLRSEESKERFKLFARLEMIRMYFPNLTGIEANRLARIMQPRAKLTRQQIRNGLTAGVKAMQETRSYHGESREQLNRILHAYMAPANDALRSSPSAQ